MVYVFLAVIALIIIFFIAIPLLAHIMEALKNFLGNILGILIGILFFIGIVFLCIMFPPLIVIVGILVVYGMVKGGASDEQ